MPSHQIIKLLNNNRSNTAYWSHVSMIQPKGKFSFHRNTYDEFMAGYCKGINSIKLGIAEKPENYIPILVDVDLKSIKDENLYTQKDIENIIKIYNRILVEILNIKDNTHLNCVVLEKKRYKVGNMYKNGFHLHYPSIFISKDNHKNILIPKVRDIITEKGIFNDYKITEIIDDSYIKNPWLLYGSRKDENLESYKITKIINKNNEIINVEDAFLNYNIYNSESDLIEKDDDIKYYLPYILSIHLNDRSEYVYEVKDNIKKVSVQKPRNSPKRKNKNKNYNYNLNTIDINLCKKLLGCLKQERIEEHNEWHKIGLILYNIFKGEETGQEIWLEWSKGIKERHSHRGNPGNFNDNACINAWRLMRKGNISMGSLKHFAKVDNNKEYNKIIKDYLQTTIKKVCDVGGTHHDIAKILFEKYGHEFKCSSYSKKVWWKFEKHIWNKNDDGIDLRRKISTEVAKMIDTQIKQLQREKQELSKVENSEDNLSSDDEDYSDEEEYDVDQKQTNHKANNEVIGRIDKKIEKLFKLISQCKQSPFKNNVMKECMELFYDPQFSKNLNSNKYLFAFKNGVYDLNENTFRDGEPDDYLTLTANVKYKIFTKEDQEVKNIIDFFEKVIPDNSVREYFIHTTSEIFVGGNHRKYVYVWQGYGHNGKTVTQNLVEKMLGEYSVKLPTSLIVGKRTASGSACPELARAGNGVRWAIAQEPEQKDIINTGILKELSGNDTFYARALFQDGGEMTPMFKLGLICNKLPQIPNADQATWNRIRIIPFESTFTDDAPTDPNEQLRKKIFPVDRDFEDKKLPGMLEAFAWFLLNYRKENKGKKLIEPSKVRAATKAYQRKNDIYRQFIEEEVVEHEPSTLSMREIYDEFKDWFKNSMPGQTTPVKNDVKEYFMNLWGDPLPGMKWKGFRIRLMTEDDNQ